MNIVVKEGRFTAAPVIAYAIAYAAASRKGFSVMLSPHHDNQYLIDAACVPEGTCFECGGRFHPATGRFDTRTSPPRRAKNDPGGADMISDRLKLVAKLGHGIDVLSEATRGIPWSCVGAYWDTYGMRIFRDLLPATEPHILVRAVTLVAENFCVPVDAAHHGVHMSAFPVFDNIHEIRLGDIVESFNPAPSSGATRAAYKDAFLAASCVVDKFFMQHLDWALEIAKLEDFIVGAHKLMANPAILVLDRPCQPTRHIMRAIHSKDTAFKQIQLVVAPDPAGYWVLRAVPVGLFISTPRTYIPMAWGNHEGTTLQLMTGCPDAVKSRADTSGVVRAVRFHLRDSAFKAGLFALYGPNMRQKIVQTITLPVISVPEEPVAAAAPAAPPPLPPLAEIPPPLPSEKEARAAHSPDVSANGVQEELPITTPTAKPQSKPKAQRAPRKKK